MLKYLARNMIRKFGRHYDYDVSYMLHMLETAPDVMTPYNALSKLAGYRKTVPVNAHMTASVLGVLHEDCGPCTQLTVDMAREAGVAPDQIEAVLNGNNAAMAKDTALAYRFATAIINRSPDEDAARQAVRDAYGDAAVVELTLATQVVRVFPMVKAGLGYAKSCQRVSIGDREVTFVKEAA